jgi:hypothetical protein
MVSVGVGEEETQRAQTDSHSRCLFSFGTVFLKVYQKFLVFI